MISAISSRRLPKKCCFTYLAYVIDSRVSDVKLKDIHVDDLPGFLLNRDVKFTIDLILGIAPISLTPYKVAPSELQELNVQLQELIDEGFINTVTRINR